jgi:outer membrane protein assembly factor BamB
MELHDGGCRDFVAVCCYGIVYVGSYDRNIYALDAATGELKWNLQQAPV